MGLLIWGGGGRELLIRGRGSGVDNWGGGGLADTREGKWGC